MPLPSARCTTCAGTVLPRGKAGHRRGTCYCDRGPGRIRGQQQNSTTVPPFRWDYTASYPGEADAMFHSIPDAERHINLLHITKRTAK